MIEAVDGGLIRLKPKAMVIMERTMGPKYAVEESWIPIHATPAAINTTPVTTT